MVDGAIAIVGAGCRFPGDVADPRGLWELLRTGTDAVTEVPESRWDLEHYYDPRKSVPGRMYSRWGAFLPDVDSFDAGFFGITPVEARQMDPQQRMLLETSWSALEDSGIVPGDLNGSRTAVFTASLGMDYLLLHSRQAGETEVDPWHLSGKEASFGAGRLSYLLGLHGPTMSVSTACSSSLVGLHLARQSLITGEADLALVGGSSLQLAPDLTLFMCQIGAMSPSGRCRVFDADADGIVRGDGCAVLVLKRLADAEADDDDILAVVRGSAVNHDGNSAGLTVPNGAAQQGLLRDALRAAEVSGSDVDYVEAHGTGTPLGDPIEVGSLAGVYGANRSEPLLIGSVKTNLGHTDSVSGAAGVLKTALALRHGEVPAHLHLEKPNPAIRWDDWPVRVPTETVALPEGSTPRLAGVSSFGLSGTNAHVILEAGSRPAAQERLVRDAPLVLPLSTTSGAALRALGEAHRERLTELTDEGELDAYVNTAATRRTHHRRRRLAVSGRNARELVDGLADRLAEDLDHPPPDGADTEDPESVVFVFSGQGSQWAGMATGLLDEPVFAEALSRCDALVSEHTGWSVLDVLRADGDGGGLASTEVAQPAVFAVQVALAELWRHWGVVPSAVVGHSMGEVTAAHVAGALELPDAVEVIVRRGRLLTDPRARGRMASIRLPEQDARTELAAWKDALCVSAVNSPVSTVVSGESSAVHELVAHLSERGVPARLMPGEYAFHTPGLRPLGNELSSLLEHLTPVAPRIPLARTTEGAAAEPTLDGAHWGRNVSEPVRFAEAVRNLGASGHRVFLEVGPHPVLTRPVLDCLRGEGVTGVATGSLRHDRPERASIGTALATLYEAGVDIDWSAVRARSGPPADVPTHPWRGPKLWFPRPSGSPVSPEPVPEEAPARTTPSEQGAFGQDGLVELVARNVAEVLGMDSSDSVRRGQGFTEMGMDSVGTVALANGLGSSLGVRVAKTAPFDHPTVRRLAEHLETLVPRDARTESAEETTDPEPPGDGAAARPEPVPAGRDDGSEPVAVVGIGCRFPGDASGPDGYWRLLREGTDAITPAPGGRFQDGESWMGGYLEGIDEFDAGFFRVPPREARVMDPQQRMFLEVAWEALENAGVVAADLAGSSTGVFAGMNSHDYAELVAGHPDNVDASYGTGVSFAASAGRLSYFLGARGPSLAVDTACSSSLVAVHLAMRSIRSGESELALAGGVNLIVKPVIHQSSELAGALAVDGRCKTFDDSADGYTRGEGCGVVVLKPLSRAISDGDDVYAVLLGSAVNNDGASGGLTVPNGPAQEEVVRTALTDAGVPGSGIGYVEAHGTGTPLGDPIELNALGNVLGEREGPRRCPVGSVKTNIGHLEAASGIAGLIKAALALHHRRIPRQLHTVRPTSAVAWEESPLRVAAEEQGFDDPERFAGVSAFGLTGTNAHVVLGAAPAASRAEPVDGDGRLVLPVSAHSASALAAQAESYRVLLENEHGPKPAGLCRTAALWRTHFDHRLVVHGSNRVELVRKLDRWLEQDADSAVIGGTADADQGSGPVFVFSGYGSQWSGMAADLIGADPVFTTTVQRCDRALREHLDWSVCEVLRGGEEPRAELDQQVLIFVLQVALAERWRAWGVRPCAVVGHSMGEVAAAHVAGALTLEEAARVMARRTRLLKELTGKGSMAVLGLPEREVLREIAGRSEEMWISVVNSGQSTVLSGSTEALRALTDELSERNVFARLITSSGPGHSPFAEPLRERLVEELAGLSPAVEEIPLYSAVRGGRVRGPDMTASFWGDNIRMPVRFADATRALLSAGTRTFLEVAPHPVLLQPIEQEMQEAGVAGATIASLRREESAEIALFDGLAKLHVHGHDLDWRTMLPAAEPEPGPTYAWQHKRYWVEHDRSGSGLPSVLPSRHPLLRGSIRTRATGTRTFEADVGEALTTAVRNGHGEQQPSAVWTELLCTAAAEITGHRRVRLRGLELPRHPERTRPRTVQLDACSGSGGPNLRLAPAPSGDSAGVSPADGPDAVGELAACTVDLVPDGYELDWKVVSDGDRSLADRWERALAELEHGPTLVAACPDAVEVLVEFPPEPGRWTLPPRLLPLAWDLAELLLGGGPVDPTAVESATVSTRSARRVRLMLRARRSGAHPLLDLRVCEAEGAELVRFDGVEFGGGEAEADSFATQRFGWRERPRRSAPSLSEGSWLLLADESGVAESLSRQLRLRGATAELFTGTSGEGELEERVRELRARGEYRGTVHLWGLDLPTTNPGEHNIGEAAGHYGSVAKAAAAHRTGERVWYVTRHGCAVGEHDVPGALRAPVWTLAGVAGVEHPEVWGGVLDLEPGGSTPEEDAAAIVEEVLGGDREDHVALRGSRRYVPRVEHVGTRVVAPAPREPGAKASYLIAGVDCGEVAAGLARDLAESGAGRVVLSGALAETADCAELTADVSRAGARLVIAESDPTRVEGARELVRESHSSEEPLAGVYWLGADFHLDPDGGQSGGAPAVSDAERRALGAWQLHRACAEAGVQPDAFAVCTGLAADWGAPGAQRAAVGDALLHALVTVRTAHGLPAVAVAVPAVEGPGLTDEYSRSRLGRSGLGTHSCRAAVDLLYRLATATSGKVFAAEADWWLLLRMYRQAIEWPLFDSLVLEETPDEAAGTAGRLAGLDDERRRSLAVELVLAEVAAVLGADSADDLDPDQGFFEQGMTSVTSLELRVRLERRFARSLPATVVFEHPNAAALAERLITEALGDTRESAEEADCGGRSTASTEPTHETDDDLLTRFTAEIDAANSLL
ncbi:type I polyketide synthase [Actinopolyspora halophila]|uniref:type I polyketide synthase n=1 Tax=Actinopolyspora halophila TaxID=1850 RepID=UPI00035CC2AC|nr:type I polyketide synthase [Actinopolyspora halophila]